MPSHSLLTGLRLRRATWFAGISITALGLAGCQSWSPSEYISPRVTGRVLDAQTRQPIRDVQVRIVTPDQQLDVDDPPKGGQAMEQTAPARTAADGTFVLDSERDLAMARKRPWMSVSVAFEHAGYQRFMTNFSMADAVNTPKGEPVVNAGDLWLRPLRK